MHHKYNLHIKDRMQLPNQRKTWPSGNRQCFTHWTQCIYEPNVPILDCPFAYVCILER